MAPESGGSVDHLRPSPIPNLSGDGCVGADCNPLKNYTRAQTAKLETSTLCSLARNKVH